MDTPLGWLKSCLHYEGKLDCREGWDTALNLRVMLRERWGKVLQTQILALSGKEVDLSNLLENYSEVVLGEDKEYKEKHESAILETMKNFSKTIIKMNKNGKAITDSGVISS